MGDGVDLVVDPAICAPDQHEVSAAEVALSTAFAELLAEIVGVAQVAEDSHFFDDLGADSMVMTRFCARVRKRPDLPPVSMKDIYRHPRVGDLAAALTTGEAVRTVSSPSASAAPVSAPVLTPPVSVSVSGPLAESVAVSVAREVRPVASSPSSAGARPDAGASRVRPAAASVAPVSAPSGLGTAAAGAARAGGSGRYVLCGAAQLLFFLAAAQVVAVIVTQGYEWVSTGSGVLDEWARSAVSSGGGVVPGGYAWMASGADGVLAVFLRSVLFTAVSFVAWGLFPIAAKWVLIGRWKPREIRVWGLGYLRFWVVKTLIRSNPSVLFVGSPIYPLYLRALGAKVGRGVAVFSRTVPVCTDLLTLGEGAVIRKDSSFTCYRAHAGVIQIGRVTVGSGALVSEATVLDINTSLGQGAQLGHASSLHPGQAVPARERWHGTPGRRTEVDFRTVAPARCGRTRMIVHSIAALVRVLVVASAVFAAVSVALDRLPWVVWLMAVGPSGLSTWTFYREALLVASMLFVDVVAAGLLIAGTLPRLLNLFLRPGKVYPLYGFHYGVHRLIVRLTNINFLVLLFGDSSAIVSYVSLLGYKLNPVEQTGSNFGTQLKHENPYVSHVGTGTVIADGLSIGSADYSSSSFRVSEVSIGRYNFLGNHIAYPSGGRTGDNCLLATKVMVPIDGEVRSGVGLLGSPSFEIPRSVQRDRKFDELRVGERLRRGLAAKNRHNAATMVVYLGVYWLHIVGLTVLAGVLGVFYGRFVALAVGLAAVAGTLFSAGYFVLMERAVQLFRPMRPLYCSIYDRRFWRHERFWKTSPVAYHILFNGTPFKSLIWRMLGVRIGRRVFDDGCLIPEKSLVSIGDDCTLNANSRIQCHSQEDGAFKSDRSQLGANVTLGVNALVHYGVTIGDGAVLDTDAFLMKGEEVSPYTWWSGNPAAEVGPITSMPATPARIEPRRVAPREPALSDVGNGHTEALPALPVLAGQGRQLEAGTPGWRSLPVVAVAASGSVVHDAVGGEFIDFTSGADPLPLGHNHPVLTAKISAQLERAVCAPDATAWVRRAYTQAELFMLPEPMRNRMRIQFGAPARGSALEAAVGLCRAATGRHDALALDQSSAEKLVYERASSMPLPAAVVMSMTGGEGEVVPARREFVVWARRRTRELGIPLVVDERATGAGRTGTWFAFEQYGIEPDVVVTSRAVSGSDQSVAVVLYDVGLRGYAVDAPCDPAARIALMATARMIDIVRRDHLLSNVEARGAQLGARLGQLRTYPTVLDVDGRGLMWGVELTAPGDGRSSAQLAMDVRERALAHGLIVQVGDPGGAVLRIQPPLTVDAGVIDAAVSALADALDEATRARPLEAAMAGGRTATGVGVAGR